MRFLTRFLRIAAGALFAISNFASLAIAQKNIHLGLPVANYGPYAPIFAAEELGYFKMNGVDVEITTYRGGPAAQEALAAGAADMIIAAPAQAALAVKKGVKQKIVGVVTTSGRGWNIIVLKDSPIKTVKELDGKNVAVTSAGSLTDIYLLWAANGAGIHVKSIPVGPAGLIPILKSKQVDAASMYEPLPYEMILSGEGRSIFDVGKDMPPGVPEVWVATQALIEKDPNAVEGVMRAVYQAVAYMKNNPARGRSFIKKFTGDRDDKIVAVEQEAVIGAMPTSARINRKWLSFALDLAKLGGMTDLPTIDQIYLERFASVHAE